MKAPSKGFTLVELMVVVSVLAILSTIIYANFGDARAQARDAERKSDLRNIQSALELYKQKYGVYPQGCKPAGSWSAQKGSGGADECSGPYIVGLAPEFIKVLPTDPKLNGAGSGYMYTTDSEGKVFKLIVMNTVETEVPVSDNSEFYRCVQSVAVTTNECASVPANPTGSAAYNTSGATPIQCSSVAQYGDDYAVVGGFADGGTWTGVYRNTDRAREYFSDIIRCK